MARRKQSPLEDLLDLASLLPPRFGLILAVLSYFLLHYFATHSLPMPITADNVIGVMSSMVLTTLASFGQYLLPATFAFGALVSWLKGRKRNALLEKTKARSNVSPLLDMSWQQFEQLVGQAFRVNGYTVVETGGNGPDGGIDLVLTKDNERYLVQCKQWRAQKVGVGVVRELYGVMSAQGAVCGFVVTAGTFTKEAEDFAEGQNIILVEGEQLLDFIRSANPEMDEPFAKPVTSVGASGPSCPACSKAMVRRLAKKGANAGKEFWGCSQYPVCRGIVAIPS